MATSPSEGGDDTEGTDFLATQRVFGAGRPGVGLDVLATKVAVDFQGLTSEGGDSCIKRNLDALREATELDAICIVLFNNERTQIERVASSSGMFTPFDPGVMKGDSLERLPWLAGGLGHLRIAEIRDTHQPRREQRPPPRQPCRCDAGGGREHDGGVSVDWRRGEASGVPMVVRSQPVVGVCLGRGDIPRLDGAGCNGVAGVGRLGQRDVRDDGEGQGRHRHEGGAVHRGSPKATTVGMTPMSVLELRAARRRFTPRGDQWPPAVYTMPSTAATMTWCNGRGSAATVVQRSVRVS